MSTNVPTIHPLKPFWSPVPIEAHTAEAPPQLYFILTFPDPSKSLVVEEEKVESEEELRQLFSEFAEEDIEMAEMGIDEFNEILLTEDVE